MDAHRPAGSRTCVGETSRPSARVCSPRAPSYYAGRPAPPTVHVSPKMWPIRMVGGTTFEMWVGAL